MAKLYCDHVCEWNEGYICVNERVTEGSDEFCFFGFDRIGDRVRYETLDAILTGIWFASMFFGPLCFFFGWFVPSIEIILIGVFFIYFFIIVWSYEKKIDRFLRRISTGSEP